MKPIKIEHFIVHFSAIPDPRSLSRIRYRLTDILLLTVAGTMSGCECWDEIEDFGNDNFEWLKNHTEFSERIPSADTIRRIFERISPRAFRDSFIQWIKQVFGEKISGHIAIDGKQLRGSAVDGKAALTLLSAYATEHGGICFAQEAVSDKSNEITGIPLLLDCIDLDGSTVSIDAIGCQHVILEKIVAKKGDYVIATKGNQPSLFQDVISTFEHFRDHFTLSQDVHETNDNKHGRIEKRIYRVITDIDWLPTIEEWPGIKSIIQVESHRTCKSETSIECRYFVSSKTANAEEFGRIIRAHWSIENSLHWVLDVNFNEDRIDVGNRNSAQNLALVRKIALTLIKAEKPKNMSFRRQAKRYNRRPDMLFQTLAQQML